MNFTSCLLLNVSLCPPTQSGAPQVVLLYNSLSRPVVSTVRLPSNSSSVKLFDAAGLPVNESVVAVLPAQVTEATPLGAAAWDVFVHVELPAMGWTTLFFYPATSEEEQTPLPEARRGEGGVGSVAGQRWQLQFDNATGLLSSVTDGSSGVVYPLQQEFLYYNSMQDNGQNSGAYSQTSSSSKHSRSGQPRALLTTDAALSRPLSLCAQSSVPLSNSRTTRPST